MKQAEATPVVNSRKREDSQISMPQVVDLFSGVGGFSLGAFRAGFSVLAAVDNDPRAARAFGINFPECTVIARDISVMTAADIKRHVSEWPDRLAGVIGGPPCQGFSCIGQRKANDKRNTLFEHFFRLVSELQPLFFIAENVTGILGKDFSSFRARALLHVDKYRILDPITLVSSDFGAPTNRTRAFFIGYLPDEISPIISDDIRPQIQRESVTVGEALRGLPKRINPAWQSEKEGWRRISPHGTGWFWERVSGCVPPGVGDAETLSRLQDHCEVSGCLGTRHSEQVIERFAALREGGRDARSRAPRLHRRKLCPTIRAGTGPERGSFQALRPIHPTQSRVITPREAARLQGFPDWFRFDGTKWHSFRQIGNSVSPILSEGILRVFYDKITGRE